MAWWHDQPRIKDNGKRVGGVAVGRKLGKEASNSYREGNLQKIGSFEFCTNYGCRPNLIDQIFITVMLPWSGRQLFIFQS